MNTCICYMYHDDDKRYKQPNLQLMGTGNNIKKLAIAITNYTPSTKQYQINFLPEKSKTVDNNSYMYT